MQRLSLTVLVIVLSLTQGCAAARAAAPRATSLNLAGAMFEDVQIIVATSSPPQFEVILTRDMPTPGWALVVDDLDVDEKAGRIVAKLTEVAPSGITAQVITKTECSLALGTLGPGRYLLEVWRRRGASTPHVLTQALVVIAR